MKASLSNYRQSPRKVRLVANLIKGKSVADAKAELNFLIKRASLPFSKLLDSAVANAKVGGADVASLYIKEVRVDKGVVLKRSMPRAFGRASRINKRSSHVLLVLGVKGEEKASEKKEKKAKEVVAEKVAPKRAPRKTTKKVTTK